VAREGDISRLLLSWDRGRAQHLAAPESDSFVASVAERLVHRGVAAAERDPRVLTEPTPVLADDPKMKSGPSGLGSIVVSGGGSSLCTTVEAAESGARPSDR
jgi:hypothetical protein